MICNLHRTSISTPLKQRTAREKAKYGKPRQKQKPYLILHNKAEKTQCVTISRSRFVAAICEFWSMPGAPNMLALINLARQT